MLEEIENPLVLHQATGKIEIALPVLNTIFSRFVMTLQFISAIKSLEYSFKDVRN